MDMKKLIEEHITNLESIVDGMEEAIKSFDGIIEEMPVLTDASGRAAATIQLGDTPSEILIAATARDVNSLLATFIGEANAPCLFTMKSLDAEGGEPLAVPQFVQLRAKPRQVRLVWTKVTDASHYNIFRANDANGPFDLRRKTRRRRYIDRKVEPGGVYFYKVQAVDGDRESVLSDAKPVEVPSKIKLIARRSPRTCRLT